MESCMVDGNTGLLCGAGLELRSGGIRAGGAMNEVPLERCVGYTAMRMQLWSTSASTAPGMTNTSVRD